MVGPRWSPRRQRVLLASRAGLTAELSVWCAQNDRAPKVWVQASAIGYYGARAPNEALVETSAPGKGFMAELCAQWEAAAKPFAGSSTRQVVLRLGVVLGHGGALAPLLLPVRLGLGGRLGSGQQMMSWIHLHDVLQLIAHSLFNSSYSGTYNAVAPQPLSQAEFVSTACALLRRPQWLHLPAAPIRLLAGEMAELFVDGQKVLPQRLLEQSFEFKFPSMHSALSDLLE